MKNRIGVAIILATTLLTGAAAAEDKKKASVSVQQVGNTTQIIIKPVDGYKWNKLYPAKVKFSVCSETSCSFYTEDVIVEEVK